MKEISMKEDEKILKLLKKFKRTLISKYKVKQLGLFGSYLKGNYRKNSDIDILVKFSENADMLDLVGLSLFLEKKFSRKIDIVSESALREELKEPILNEVVYV